MEQAVEHPTVLDSTEQRIGETYARALLAVAAKAGKRQPLLDQLDAVVDQLAARLPGFLKLLESPRVGLAVKLDLLERALAGRVEPELKWFLMVLARKGRFDCLRRADRRAARWTTSSADGSPRR